MPSSDPLLEYRVSLGLYQVRVQGRSLSEALSNARKQLALELPRLWDVIQQSDDSRFIIALEAQS